MIATGGPPGCVASAEVKARPRRSGKPDGREIIRADAVPARLKASPSAAVAGLRIGGRMDAGALHASAERCIPNGTVAEMLTCSTPGKRGESLARACDRDPARASDRSRPGSRRLRGGKCSRRASPVSIAAALPRAANEERRRGQERERECDLHDDERIAREKFPAPPNDIFAGLFLSDRRSRRLRESFSAGPSAKESVPSKQKPKVAPRIAGFGPLNQTMSIGSNLPERSDEQIGGPKPEEQPADAAEKREDKPSMSSCLTMRPRLPPSASRIAISLRRAVPRASSMFARLRQATSRRPPPPCRKQKRADRAPAVRRAGLGAWWRSVESGAVMKV